MTHLQVGAFIFTDMFKTHGLSSSRLYSIWGTMKQRINNPKDTHYKYYGGRGLSLCKEWYLFITFYNWAINNGYQDQYTIDRIDNDKGYYPENCRWGTVAQNNANKPSKRIGNWGIYPKKKGYYAQVCVNEINYYGGYSEDINKVIKMRDDLVVKLNSKTYDPDSGSNLTDVKTRKIKAHDIETGRFIWV